MPCAHLGDDDLHTPSAPASGPGTDEPVLGALARAMVRAEEWCAAHVSMAVLGINGPDLIEMKAILVGAIEAYGRARSERDTRELRATLEAARRQLDRIIGHIADLHASTPPTTIAQRPLIPLAEFDERRAAVHRRPEAARRLNGIACPQCGAELLDTSPDFTCASNPPRKYVQCDAHGCGYRGTRVA